MPTDRDSSPARPRLVFISYAHKDYRLFEQLCDALVPLERRELVKRWEDRQVPPGGEWDRIIREKLRDADIVVFLVSHAFIASRYCWEVEVSDTIERGTAEEVAVLPIYLEDVEPELTPFGELKYVPWVDGQRKPVRRFGHRASAWKIIQKEITEAAALSREAGNGEDGGSLPQALRRVWHGTPARPATLAGRADLLDRMPAEFGASGPRRTIALVGEGGTGKTSVAVEYCYRRQDDYDFVFWLQADPPARLATEYAAMAMKVGVPVPDQQASKAAFYEWLQSNDRWLVVFDNAGEPEELRAYLPEAVNGDVIVTSRKPKWDRDARQIPIEPLTPPEAMRYLLDTTGTGDLQSAAELIDLSGGNPRELELAALAVAQGRTLAAYVAEIRERLEEGE